MGLRRRFDVLADAVGLERTADLREILDAVIKKVVTPEVTEKLYKSTSRVLSQRLLILTQVLTSIFSIKSVSKLPKL